ILILRIFNPICPLPEPNNLSNSSVVNGVVFGGLNTVAQPKPCITCFVSFAKTVMLASAMGTILGGGGFELFFFEQASTTTNMILVKDLLINIPICLLLLLIVLKTGYSISIRFISFNFCNRRL